MIENEILIMRSCNHPNIVKLHEEFETKEHVYLVTDLVKVS
jgi:serine/threonine protein kinase